LDRKAPWESAGRETLTLTLSQGVAEGEGLNEGSVEGDGLTEGDVEGEGITEGSAEGEGPIEEVAEGEGLAEGMLEGAPHASDYVPQNWSISLVELLRVIPFFNIGGYSLGGGTEDGFLPGSGGSRPGA